MTSPGSPLTRISDFVVGEDSLRLVGYLDQSQLVIDESYGGTTVGIGDNKFVFLSGVKHTDLTPASVSFSDAFTSPSELDNQTS